MSVEIIFKHFPDLTSLQKNQFTQLGSLYADWNSKINLISRKDIDALYEKHILHSLAIAKFISFNNAAIVMDVGTGGGFPAIPLAIIFKETKFLAIDSIGKKIKVVQAIADAVGLNNVEAINARAESLTVKVDFVISRATAPLADLVKWTTKNISKENKHPLPNGIICLKGGGLEEELLPYKKSVHVEQVTDFINEPVFADKRIIFLPL